MADKRYSISRAIRDILLRGVPMYETEREPHFAALRAFDNETRELAKFRAGNARDMELRVPLEEIMSRDLGATVPGLGAGLIGVKTYGRSDLLSWSVCARAGALFLTGLDANATLWQIGTLPVPSWVPEGTVVSNSDPGFLGFNVTPHRISAMLYVSKQLLAQTSEELDRILIADISRQLGSYLDQCALYGTGSANHQPLGLANVSGVSAIPITQTDFHTSFCQAEATIEVADVSMDSYAVLASPGAKELLRTQPAFTGGHLPVWNLLRNPQSSPEVSDNRCFVGAWSMMTFCLWGSLEVLINPFTFADTNRVRISATLLADVGVRLPAAFGITAALT